MSSFAQRNAHFDRLFATNNLFWLDQNTNHLPMHPQVRQAMIDSIEAEEFHAYAPPGGFTALSRGIVADLGLPQDAMSALILMARWLRWRPCAAPTANRARIS